MEAIASVASVIIRPAAWFKDSKNAWWEIPIENVLLAMQYFLEIKAWNKKKPILALSTKLLFCQCVYQMESVMVD